MGSTTSRAATTLDINANEQISSLAAHFTEKPNEQSLRFLHQVWKKNPAALNKLPAKLKRNAAQSKTHLKAHHVDKAIASLYKQMELPTHILATIDTYLAAVDPSDITSMIHVTRTGLIASPSSTLGILERSLHVIGNLKLLTNQGASGVFLRTIIGMMINFHEKEQNNVARHKRPHAITADNVSTWLITTLAIPDTSDLKKFIHFLADRIIVLGTTVITGPARVMDLSELFFVFEEVAIQAKFQVVHESNLELINDINAIMLTLGICRKKPTAFYDVVALQQNNIKTATLPLLKQYYQEPLLLEQFFKGNTFQRYFGKRDSLDAINQQAFLISLVTHLSLRSDANDDNQQAVIYDMKRFITLCRKQRTLALNDAEFIQWFTNACVTHNMARAVKLLFFSAIDHKVSLNLSQVGSLVFVANKLVSMGFSPRSATVAATGQFQPLISPDVPMNDAKNLKAINVFFNQLDLPLQEKLGTEILLAMVVQADTIYAKQPGLTAQRHKKFTPTTTNTRTNAVTMQARANTKTRRIPHHDGFFTTPMQDTSSRPKKSPLTKHTGIRSPSH